LASAPQQDVENSCGVALYADSGLDTAAGGDFEVRAGAVEASMRQEDPTYQSWRAVLAFPLVTAVTTASWLQIYTRQWTLMEE
jgi:hypothetical protein